MINFSISLIFSIFDYEKHSSECYNNLEHAAMAELLLIIYMVPVLIVFGLLLRLVMWIIGLAIRLTWWLVKNGFVLAWKVLLFIVVMVIANLRATGSRNY